MKLLSTCAWILLAAALAIGQQPTTPPAPPAHPTPPVQATPKKTAPEGPPVLTEAESLRLENLQLKAAMLQQQFNETPPMRDLNEQYGALTARLNQEHPGWAFNAATKTFVRAPASQPPAAAAPEAKK